MDRIKSQKYSLLGKGPLSILSPVDDADLDEENEAVLDLPRPRKHQKRYTLVARLCCGGLLLAVPLLAFYLGWVLSSRSLENACVDTAWHDLRSRVRYVPYTFDPHFVTPPSEYMGQPSPELDERWYHLAGLRNFAVDRETLVRANKSTAAVQWPGTEKYQAGLEAFHQLHCLNYVRMYTYMDHYGKVDFDMLQEPLEERTQHKDHCIDVLRQHLMCAPDLNIYTFHWTKHSAVPFFDLSTNHKCIDWDAFDSWTAGQMVHKGVPPKPSAVHELLD